MIHLREPYRIFFPLGMVCGLAGVAIWPLYSFGITTTYSGRSHALVQIFGFLYAFIAGFLLTAVPRFTGTPPPSLAAQLSVAAALLLAATASELRFFLIGTTAFVVAHGMVVILLARRFARRQQNPPPSFAYIGLALVAGVAGALILAGVAAESIPPTWDLVGKRLLTEGMVMLLVLGVGGYLGPRLLGFAPPPSHAVPAVPSASSTSSAVTSFIAGAVILTSIVAEYALDRPRMGYVRAFVISTVVIRSLQLWRLPATRSTLSWAIWLAHWMIAGGVWAVAVAPKYGPDLLHIVFIGGFSLLILAIAMRVALSHGGHSLAAEERSWPLRIGLTLMVVAMLARLGAPFAANSYFSHLQWAALLWIAALVVWGAYVLRLQ